MASITCPIQGAAVATRKEKRMRISNKEYRKLEGVSRWTQSGAIIGHGKLSGRSVAGI